MLWGLLVRGRRVLVGWLVVDLEYGRGGGITGLAGVVAGLHAVVHGHFCGGEDALWGFIESAFFVLFLHR